MGSVASCENRGRFRKIEIVEIDDIISYHDVVTAEKASLQKGMNYGVAKRRRITSRSFVN